MSVSDTVLGRVKKLLRVKFEIKTGSASADTALGGPPIGFEASLIQSEFRLRLNDWLADLIPPFPSASWDEDTTLADVVKASLDASKIDGIKKIAVYRAHVADLTESAFDAAAGEGAQNVPVASRPAVQEQMNDELEGSLLTDISLADLAGDKPTILSNVTDRMTI
jgi:hypothetical protein